MTYDEFIEHQVVFNQLKNSCPTKLIVNEEIQDWLEELLQKEYKGG